VTRTELLQSVTDFYLESPDFNGIPARMLPGSEARLKKQIQELVELNQISINFGDRHPNPHILAFAPEAQSKQLEKLSQFKLAGACLYPSKERLADVVDRSKYRDEPFRLKLALGEPQLSYYSFDLSILEIYRNDPRYHYRNDDISGCIGVTSTASLQGQMRAPDETYLQTFGFSYDEQINRAVAVFLWYLRCLTPEHQRIWNTKLLLGNFNLHPDYWRMTAGNWPERISIFTAFLEEQHHINEIARLIGRPRLFRAEYTERDRPRGFGFLIRPTLEEFNDFVLVLDKLLSENIDTDFFCAEVPFDQERARDDGKVVVLRKGTIQLLADWLNQTVRFPDPGPKDGMLSTFRKIRKLRQKPAHAIDENAFDQKYFKDQRKLIMDAYNAVRTLRLILMNHPDATSYQVPESLKKGKIWTH
jgi:hypothetical protein